MKRGRALFVHVLIIVMVLLCNVCAVTGMDRGEGGELPQYSHPQINAFARMARYWEQRFEAISPQLEGEPDLVCLHAIKEELARYQQEMLSYDDVAEWVTIGAGIYYTQKEGYYLPPNFQEMDADALKPKIDDILYLIHTTLVSRLRIFDPTDPLNQHESMPQRRSVSTSYRNRLMRALRRLLPCICRQT